MICTGAPALFALLVLLCLTVSCTAGQTTDSEVMTDIPISEYVIVRGDASDSTTLRQVVALKDAIESRYGVSPVSSTDWAEDTMQGGQTGHREILVGVTNREKSRQAQALLDGKMGFVISSSDNCFVITASTGKLLESAVNVFISSYLDTSKDGLLPADIELVRTGNAAFYRVGDDPICLLAPQTLSPRTVREIGCFTELLDRIYGVRVEVIRDENLDGVLMIGAMKDLSERSKEESRNVGEKLSEEQFEIRFQKDRIVLKGASETALTAALGKLYERFAASADETLDGVPTLSFPKAAIFHGVWRQKAPRLTGGRYLTSEEIASGATRTLYENVPQDAVDLYKQLLVTDMDYLPGTGNTYVSNDSAVQISLVYDGAAKELEVIESTLK